MANTSTLDRILAWLARVICYDTERCARIEVIHGEDVVGEIDALMGERESGEGFLLKFPIDAPPMDKVDAIKILAYDQLDAMIGNHVSGLAGNQRYVLRAWRLRAGQPYSMCVWMRQGVADSVLNMSPNQQVNVYVQASKDLFVQTISALKDVNDERRQDIIAIREDSDKRVIELERQLGEERKNNNDMRAQYFRLLDLNQKYLDRSLERELDREERKMRMGVVGDLGGKLTGFIGKLSGNVGNVLPFVKPGATGPNVEGVRVPELRALMQEFSGASSLVDEKMAALQNKLMDGFKATGMGEEMLGRLANILLRCIVTTEEATIFGLNNDTAEQPPTEESAG